ncbi:MAG TPA: gamma-glutamyl-gamma-aminobutyrate hydrolase family protein [Solirubrobacteraceae bacterium]|nr:gamma-glutamyl-gamma-aminobutyrate hydrolase family protein [Solirubrobacteraceae bacterium]
MPRPPVIGVCTLVDRARWAAWYDDVAFLQRSVVVQVQQAGGMALLLPPDPVATVHPDVMLDLLDALMLVGGPDLDPALYGARPHPAAVVPQPDRDAFELALARGALERELPFLGICRGMHVLNVVRGGTLVQHLPDVVGHEEHRRVVGSFDGADHDVRLAPGSLAARAVGAERHRTKSHHHQGLHRIGEGLEVTGWALMDDVPEAIEDPSVPFALGVQWHPEADELSRVIGALVQHAGAAVS